MQTNGISISLQKARSLAKELADIEQQPAAQAAWVTIFLQALEAEQPEGIEPMLETLRDILIDRLRRGRWIG